MSNFFEKKIKGYYCKFNLLDEIVKNQEEASNYYAWVRDNYKEYFERIKNRICENGNKFLIDPFVSV